MSIAFIVDGFCEQRALSQICKGATIRRLDLNGSSVGVPAIAKKLASLVRLLDHHRSIFIIVDRENRSQESIDLEVCLCNKLREHKVDMTRVHVSFCDRMIENWILADVDLMRSRFGERWESFSYECTDGMSGKSVLKGLFGSTKPYNEVSDGAALLAAMNPFRARAKNKSLDRFLAAWNIQCHWLDGKICAAQDGE